MSNENGNNKHFIEKMLEFETQIQQAISEVFNQEAIFEDVCQEIQSSFNFDFCLISLVNPEKNVDQTVYQNNLNGDNLTHSYIRYKYYLEKNPYLRSIRADIIQTRNIEIISGSDKRLNPWIVKKEKKNERVRIYIPIILIKDKNGNIIEDWFENCECKVITKEQTEDSYRVVIKIDLSKQENQTLENIQVIGVVGAIYEEPSQEISIEQVLLLAKLVSLQALKIHRIQLSHILEVITKNAQHILQADAAAIDFMYQPEQQNYIYQVCTGNIDENFTSRKQKLRQQTLQEGKQIFVTNSHSNLTKLFGKKNKTMVSCPLIIDHKQGFLYLEFNNEYEISQDKISLLNLFINRANNVIFHGIVQADKQAQETQINNIYLFTKFLIDNTDKDIIIQHILRQIFNIIGADVVILNEYFQSEDKVITIPEIAGRLIQEQDNYPELNQDDKSLVLIKHGANIYDSSLENSEIFKNSDFVKQENIASVASIVLKVGDEIVGVMFINYRRMYNFSKDEQKVIETLASAAAYAIKNQRSLQSWLDTLSDIERELITTLEEKKLLCKIVQRAVEKTEADFGSIRLLVKNNQQLDTKAFYPENTTRKVLQRTSITQGITGWVAQTRESARVNDVQEDSRYVGDKDNVRSELCVPILDEQENLIGVLNVESNQVNAFDPKELQLLEQLADLTVIAIKNATKQEQLAKAEVMATLGDIAGPLVHRTNNNVGAIRVLAQDICDEADESIKSFAIEIVSIAEQVIEYSQRMRSWIRDKPQVLNLEQIIQETLLQIQVPQNINQNINLDSDLHQVCAGKQQLINVFDNLIQNAINAMFKGGKLLIRGSNFKINTNNWIKVCILDTGVGIAQENLQKIFEPGYSTKDSTKNMGFGLWWTKFYIERLEGYLEVESEVGKGTKFTILLPAYKQEV